MAPNSRKTVLITGCSAGGIGSALAQAFHARGLRVFASARDLSKLAHLQEAGMEILKLDVEDQASIEAAVKEITTATGGVLDILVNNSGIGQAGPIIDSDLDYSRKMFEVNFFGRVAMSQAVMPLIIESRGMILNIGSIAGVCPQPWKGMYNASCAAVHHWSDTLRIEMAPLGVVTGAVRTNFITNQPSVTLEEGSIYLPARNSIEKTMNAEAVAKNFIDADIYARQVVKNVLRDNPVKRQWAGGVAGIIWLVSAFLWSTSWDILLAEQFAINDVKRKVVLQRK